MSYQHALRELATVTAELEALQHVAAGVCLVDGALAAALLDRALTAYNAVRAAHAALAMVERGGTPPRARPEG